MENFKGTKGGWIVKHSLKNNQWNVVGTLLGHKYKVARCPYEFLDGLDDYNRREYLEAKANALLISKAPEMLEMLKKVYDSIVMQSEIEYGSEMHWQIEDLIKEATEL